VQILFPIQTKEKSACSYCTQTAIFVDALSTNSEQIKLSEFIKRNKNLTYYTSHSLSPSPKTRALRDGDVHLFVCWSVRLFVCCLKGVFVGHWNGTLAQQCWRPGREPVADILMAPGTIQAAIACSIRTWMTDLPHSVAVSSMSCRWHSFCCSCWNIRLVCLYTTADFTDLGLYILPNNVSNGVWGPELYELSLVCCFAPILFTRELSAFVNGKRLEHDPHSVYLADTMWGALDTRCC